MQADRQTHRHAILCVPRRGEVTTSHSC